MAESEIKVVEVKEVSVTYDDLSFFGKIIDGKYVTAQLEIKEGIYDMFGIIRIHEMLGKILNEETK